MLNIANYIKELSGYNVRVAYPRHGFVAAGAENILRTDAATIAGLILSGRDDNVNCCIENEGGATRPGMEEPAEQEPAEVEETVEVPEEPKEEPAKKPKEEPAEEPKKKPEPEKKKKEKRPFIWTILGKAGKAINDVYENATNEMNDEKL